MIAKHSLQVLYNKEFSNNIKGCVITKDLQLNIRGVFITKRVQISKSGGVFVAKNTPLLY
jgi:hypothetical protein